jgi:cation/acetate symporter
MLSTLNGASAEQVPDWFRNWEKTGLIAWFDDGDNIIRYTAREDNEVFRRGAMTEIAYANLIREHQRWIDTGGAQGTDARVEMRAAGLSGPDRDIIVLATPEMARLSSWIVAFLAAGGLAAALSTASGLLLVVSSSVAHDLYYRVINPQATEKLRLLVGRGVIGIAVMLAGLLGIYPPASWGRWWPSPFGLAASSFFPVIVVGIFSKRAGSGSAILGMLTGISFTAYYIIAVVFFGMERWTFGIFPKGISPEGIGAIGMLLIFAATLLAAPFFPKPREEILQLVDSIREPEGLTPVVEIEEAAER